MTTNNKNNPIPDIKIPELNSQAANQLLNNVLAVCDKAPNVIPVDTIQSVSYIKTSGFRIGRLISIFMFIFLLFLPLFFIVPTLTVTPSSLENSNKNAVYIATVDSLFPVAHISATINGDAVPVVSTKNGDYSISFPANGNANVTVKTLNHQSQTVTFIITDIDKKAPSLVSFYRKGDFVYVIVNDAGSGINFEEIVAYTSSNTAISPDSYDKETGTIVFPNVTQPLSLNVPDKKGNVLHVILTPVE